MRTKLHEMVRYGAKGGVGLVANIALMTALVELTPLSPALAAPISTSVLMLAGYVVIDRWVFPDAPDTDRRGHLRRGLWYYAVIWTGKAANYAIFLVLLGVGLPYQAAWLAGAVAVFFGTFSANRYLWHGSLA